MQSGTDNCEMVIHGTDSIGGTTPCDTWGGEPSTVRQPVYLMGAPPATPNPTMHRRH
jgi:hypothetical protein